MTVLAAPHVGQRLETSIVTTREGCEALRAEWLDLLDRAVPPLALEHDPDVLLAAFSDPDKRIVPRVVVVRSDGRVSGIAPLYLHRAPVPLRLSVIQVSAPRAMVLRLFGDRMILDCDADAQALLDAIFQALETCRAEFDLLWIYTQRLADPLWSWMNSPRARRFKPFITSACPDTLHKLRLTPNYDAYLAQVRTKSGFPGKTIRRFWRDHKERCAVVRIDTPDRVEALLDGVDRVYNRSWQAKTYGGRNRKTAADIRRLKAVASLGFLRSYLLTEEGVAIAFVLGHQYRGHYFYDETGYDPERASVSPGSVLTHAVIEDLFRSNRPDELDFGFGDGAYKRTFGNATEDVCSLYLVPPGRWRAILSVQQALDAADTLGRATVTRLGIAPRVRRLLKRQARVP